MVGSSKESAPEEEIPEKSPPVVKKPRAARAKKPREPAAQEPEKAPDPLMMIPEDEPPREPEIPPEESPPKKIVPAPLAKITIPPGGKRPLIPEGFDRKKGAIIAGILVIIVVAALLFSGILPSPHPVSSAGNTAPEVTTVPTETPEEPVTVATTLPVTTATPEVVSLVPGPTQEPPENLMVFFQAERDPRSELVTVQYMGGKGQMGVREVFVRLTRSDGQVLTDSFKPIQIGSGVELQGTEKTDRLEVIVRYYTGDEYVFIDKLFEYKIRSL
jgi:hypothetical protein